MAARSVKCTVRNESKQHNLALYEAILDHGTWGAEWSPPDHIPFGTERTWGSESDGFLTGTEGHATYWVGDTGAQVVFYFDNPFAGSNTFTQKLLVPAANGGPGVPDYEPFDPMRPDDPQSRYKQTEDQAPQFAHGSDIKVVYCFRQHEAPAEAPPPPAATTAAVSATPEAQTTVMCSPGFRKVVFIGCTYFSSLAESKQLQKQVSDLTIVTPDPSNGKLLMNDADFVKDTPLLDKVRDRLTALENADDPVQTTLYTKPPPVPVGNAPRILMIRALAKMLANVDSDLNPGADCLALKRLVISGHHCGAWTNGREDVIWGSDSLGSPPHQILTLFNDGGGPHGVLAGLAEIFPKAFLQVEDLCFSACLTGYLSSPIPAKMFSMFKNLQTLWAYENESPNAADPCPGQASKLSSNRAICDWEIASRTAGSSDALDKASRALRATFKGNVDVGKSIIWVKGSPLTVED